MWHYAIGTERRGPVSQAEIEALLRSGAIDRSTLVWREGMPQWMAVANTELAAVAGAPLPPPPGVPGTPGSSGFGAPPPARYTGAAPFTPQQFESTFKVWMWTAIGGNVLALTIILSLLAVPVIIVAVVFQMILLYRMWELIQDGQARTTPGKAIGFLFIPLFNFYWVFVAIYGLACDMNAHAARAGVPAPRASEGLGLAVAILYICTCSLSWVPFVGLGSGVVLLILEILYLQSAKATAVAIAQHRQSASLG